MGWRLKCTQFLRFKDYSTYEIAPFYFLFDYFYHKFGFSPHFNIYCIDRTFITTTYIS